MDANSPTRGLPCRVFLNKDDSISIFQIPSQFVKSVGEDLPKEATLRIDEYGKCWKVTVEKFHGQYFFTEGWKDFAKDVDIKSWDCLLLNSAGLSQFGFSPDESNDGHREMNSGQDKDTVPRREEAPFVGKEWKFTKEVKETSLYRFVVPRKFAVETGIAKTDNVTLMDAKGRKWLVRVSDKRGDLTMGSGWNAFLIANKVSVGSIILFKFVSCSNMTMEAQVVKEGTDKSALFNSLKRKRGKYEFDASHKTSDGTERKALSSFVERKGGKYEIVDSCKTNEETVGNAPLNSVERKHENHEAAALHNAHEYGGKSAELRLKPTCESNFGGGGRLTFSKKLKKHHSHALGIPKEFVIGARITTDRTIKLKDAEGREWPVRATDKNTGSFSFTAGWRKFLMGNKVVVGSMVYFELTPNNTIEARLSKEITDEFHENVLFSCVKKNRKNRSSYKRSDCGRLNATSSLIGDCVSGELSFSKELKKHDLYNLGIPENFARKTGIAESTEVKLQHGEGRKWTVQVTDKRDRVYLSTGWCDFLKSNSLVIGSTISFIWCSDNTMETRIVKEGTDRQALFKFLRLKGKRFEIIESENRGDHAKVHADSILNVKSENKELIPEEAYDPGEQKWRYSKELKEHNAYKLDLPRNIGEVIGKESIEEIKLQDGKGRKWPVHVRHRKGGTYALTTGWIDFLVGNKVCIGSTILFEFIPSSRNVIEAQVLDCGNMGSVLFAKETKGNT